MAFEYSISVCQELEAAFYKCCLHRPLRINHYDAGTVLTYEITLIETGPSAKVRLCIEKFVGGGYAGQVYKVRLDEICIAGQPVERVANLMCGKSYAIKILIPPSMGSRLFRNFLYAVGFQGPFQLQVNPAAARAGALWQKFIRAAAQVRFNDPQCVNDIHATFVDSALGSCGEISDWVEGRTWRLEVDDHLDQLRQWKKGKTVDTAVLGSPEYRSKYIFMKEFVKLLHDVGAHEFARQYEWTTCKSQPNALKRTETNAEPTKGLIAVDFRAGLALLPFGPMSPGDFKLIWQGLKRGSLVQFDQGSIETLERYLASHPVVRDAMPDADKMLEELKQCEEVYRHSIPDITHNHIQLLYDGHLWQRLFDSAVTGWKTRNLIDPDKEEVFRSSKVKTFLFFLLGLIPLLGKVGRRIWAKADWRAHYAKLLTSFDYFVRAFKGRMAETQISWHRAGRLDAETSIAVFNSPVRFLLHVPVSILPAGLHRFMTDPQVLKEKLFFLFVRPFQLYFNAALREQWLRDMVLQGKKKHILSDEDAVTILSQVNEPYIQKYLVSLMVHLMTLPVTQIVSGTLALIFYITHPDMPEGEKAAAVAGILVLFQVIPISPGSFCRGAYTTLMAIRDHNFKDYNIALFLSYFKYVGYLAFPIQMTYRYPALARFMAAHWATDAVHIVPVFGERGALLEHWIFCLFYNWPLTIRRRMQRISEIRRSLPVRGWHIVPVVLLATGIFVAAHYGYYTRTQIAPTRENLWFIKPLFCLIVLVPAAGGWAITRFAGGLLRIKRIALAALGGLTASILYSFAARVMALHWNLELTVFLVPLIWRGFGMAVFGVIGALIAEIRATEVNLQKR
jgi:hypothetical protein